MVASMNGMLIADGSIERHLEDSSAEQQDRQQSNVFLQFSQLPLQVRLMIWEYTWPEPRIVEGGVCQDDMSEEDIDVANLRPAGPLFVCLRDENFWSRMVELDPLEMRLYPVALQICRESRRHTLANYLTMEHTNSTASRFYFNPCRDIVWLSFDFIDDPGFLRDLRDCYGEQLGIIQICLVQQSALESEGLDWYYYHLRRMTGLRTIILLLDGDNKHDYEENNEYSDEDEGVEDGALEEGKDTHSDKRQEFASQLRAKQARFLQYSHRNKPHIVLMNRTGTIF